MAGCRYKVVCNQLGKMPNNHLASDPGKELHPPTLIIMEMHGSQVKRERDMDCKD